MSDLTNFTSWPEDNFYPLSNVASREWKSFAMYTVENRAIPNMIDGLKPRYEDESKRLYFVSGTESSLYRKRRGGIKKRRKAGKAKSLEKFEKWLETKVSTGNGGQPVAL